MTATTVRFTLAVCLSSLLTACASTDAPSAIVMAPPAAQINDRFSEDGLKNAAQQYASSEPRVYISQDKLEPDAPDTYTVVRGDTLWDISDRFLKQPWLWPKIWSFNPQIKNPHLIYPGDVLALEYVDGKPSLVLTRKRRDGAAPVILDADGNQLSGGRVQLFPRIRSESLDDAIPTISADSIEQFLVHPRVVDATVIENAPYVIGNYDSRLISAVGHKVFVRGELNRDQTSYGVFRRSKELRDPVNNALLGFEVTHVADATLLSTGDPSAVAITRNKMETMDGDILLPTHDGSATHSYEPRLPSLQGEGRIVSLVNAISQTGRDQVIVLNMGTESSIQEGDVLAIETRGKTIIDPRGIGRHEEVTLPNQRTGVVMVFKTFGKVSYALVMESTRPVMVNDIVTGI